MVKLISRHWSELPPELLELVAKKLDFIDVPCFKGVCSSFRLAAEVRSSVTPLLMHQSTDDHGDADEFHRKFGKTVRFLNPYDTNALIYSPQRKGCLERLLDNGCCIGSSHGWLVVLDKEVNPFLLNPFSGAEIELPKKESFLEIMDEGFRDIDIEVGYDGCVPEMRFLMDYAEDDLIPTRISVIKKAILTGNPSYSEDYKVFIIFGDCPTRIAFCCPGDRKWRPLSCAETFYDAACHHNRLYTIQKDYYPPPISLNVTCIRRWDLSSAFEVPQEECGCQTVIFVSDSNQLPVYDSFPNCFVNYYLVSSGKELFSVVGFIGSYSNPDTSSYGRTIGFEVYKLEGEDEKELVRVESLPGQAIFLGGNHGMVISAKEYDKELNENSIYFTSHYTDTFLDSSTYEIGIYSLENRSVKLLCDVQKEKPLPFWVFPGQRKKLSVSTTDN